MQEGNYQLQNVNEPAESPEKALADFYRQAGEKIKAFNEFVTQNGLADRIVTDHIGYKCSSAEEFARLRALIEQKANFLYQSIISNRRIAIIKLTQSMDTAAGSVTFLELADQKPDMSQISGFDHLEFFAKQDSAEKLAEELTNKGVEVAKTVRPHHTTYDMHLIEGFKARIESESLIEKIIREEIKK